jgi:hypothetical protein
MLNNGLERDDVSRIKVITLCPRESGEAIQDKAHRPDPLVLQ